MMRLLVVAIFTFACVDAQQVEFNLNSVNTSTGFALHILENAYSADNVEVVSETDCDSPNFWGWKLTSFWAYGGCVVTLRVNYTEMSAIYHTIEVHGKASDPGVFKCRTKNKDVGQIGGMEVLEQRSPILCIYKTNFWYVGYVVYTSHRCRAKFRIWYNVKPQPLCVIKYFSDENINYRPENGEFFKAVKPLLQPSGCRLFRYSRRVIVLRRCPGYYLICKYKHYYNCQGIMDPHFTSLDLAKLSIRPSCWYMASCTLPSIKTKCMYRIYVKTEHKIQSSGTWITAVRIEVPKAEIFLDKDVTVNDEVVVVNRTTSPYVILDAGVCIYYHKFYIRVVLRCGVVIKWDYLRKRFDLTLPFTYITTVKGICGNANCLPYDDLLTADGTHISEFQSKKMGYLAIARQWVIPDPSNEDQCTA